MVKATPKKAIRRVDQLTALPGRVVGARPPFPLARQQQLLSLQQQQLPRLKQLEIELPLGHAQQHPLQIKHQQQPRNQPLHLQQQLPQLKQQQQQQYIQHNGARAKAARVPPREGKTSSNRYLQLKK
jgi:hypothetical protein